MNPLKRPVTGGLFVVALAAAACGGGSSSSTSTSAKPSRGFTTVGATPHVYEGTVGGNPPIVLNCAPPGYVQRDPSTGPNIGDRPNISYAGSDRFVKPVDVKSGGEVPWGHDFSRLATQISANVPQGPILKGKHFKFTFYCTSTQDDAWVVAWPDR